MRRFFGQIVVVGLLVLAWAGTASAFEYCMRPTNYANKFKFEVTQFGNYFNLNGSDRTLEGRAVYGTAYAVGSTAQVGFTSVSNSISGGCDVTWNASLNLSLSPPSGPYSARLTCDSVPNSTISGTMTVIPGCIGVTSSDSLPDAGAQ